MERNYIAAAVRSVRRREMAAAWQRGAELAEHVFTPRIEGSSRCVHCGKPILLDRGQWLHPIEIDTDRMHQRWALYCYQPPSAEPEPGWND
jgi:hypothetical protein